MNIFGKLLVVSIFGQVLNFSIHPIIAIYYSPEELGEFRYYLGVLSFLLVVSSLAYEKAIYKVSNENKIPLIVIGVFSSSIISFIVFLLGWYKEDVSILLVSFMLLPSVLFLYANSYLSSLNKFSNVYKLKIYQFGSSFLFKVVFSVLALNFKFLFIAELISKLIGLIFFFKFFLRNFKKNVEQGGLKLCNLYAVFKDNASYPMRSLPGMTLNAVSLFFPLYFIERYYGYSEVGLFALCLTLTQGPLVLFAGNISTVIQVAYKDGLDRVKCQVSQYVKLIIFLFSILPLFIYLNSGILIDVLFSDKWSGLKDIILPLSIFSFFWGISSPFSVVFHLFEREGVLFKIQVGKFLIRFFYLYYCHNFLNFKEYVIGFVVLNCALQLWQLIISLHTVGIKIIALMKECMIGIMTVFFVIMMLIFFGEAKSLDMFILNMPIFFAVSLYGVYKIANY